MIDPARSFVVIAKDDLMAARMLAEGLPRIAAFHVQQTAEKLLKAMLTALGVEFGRHHKIDLLAAQLPDDHPLSPDFRDFSRFTPYGAEHRYPSQTYAAPPAPSQAELLAALRELERLTSEVEGWLARQGRPPHIPR